MNQITCILDACSVINLIHIDVDDFLVKKLKHIDCYICQKVLKEVNTNVFDKLNKLRKGGELRAKEAKERKKEIDKTLNVFRRKQKMDYELKHELGDDFFDQVKDLANYFKANGEFYSTALALYLSRCKPFESNPNDFAPTKLFFHTDDSPAKKEFASFYLQQQIGYIEDTADLLVLLYRLDDDFTQNQLDEALSNLSAEYAREVKFLEKKLSELKSTLPVNLIKDRKFASNFSLLVRKLREFDFEGISEIRTFFFTQKSKYRIVCDLLQSYNSVFELDTDSTDLLKKIKLFRGKIKDIYRL